jgi:hypothetical protein
MTQWGLDTLFNPAKRHMDEEKRRLQATRQQVGDTSGGKRIDLESGKVRIKPSSTGEAEATEAEAAELAAADAEHEGGAPAEAPPEENPAPKKELTPAQLRAAQRRGRAPR